MKATPKTVKTLLLLFLYYFICTTDVNAYGGEVYFNATDLDGAATIVTVSVYTYDPALKSLVLYGADKTFSFQKYFGGIGYYNGVLDIAGGLYDPDSWFHLPAADEYFIRITDIAYKADKYFKLEYHPYENDEGQLIEAYGDFKINDQAGNISYSNKSSTCAYDVYGPFDWVEHTIKLSNKFGNDYASCAGGDIRFNSTILHNIGYNKVSLTRESSTFPHTIASIDGQVVGGFVRKWRNWNDVNPAYSTTTASIDNYDFTANYAKQVNAILGANVTGCKIKINGTENSLPLQNTYFYDDILYQFEAFSQTVDYVNYQFDHWDYNGTYTTQNPLQINKPSSNLNLTVYYKGKPLFYEVPTSLRGLSVTQEINNPLNLSWNEHPSTKVTNYKIYRKVKNTLSWVNPVCLATVPRGTTSYDDLEYFYLSNSYTVILYDVRAYCQEFNTVSDSIFQGPYFGTLSKSSNYTSFQDGTIPENSLGNYPNPFNPSTKVLFSIKENAFVVLQIYDILGNKVSDLVNEFLIARRYSINFNANNLPSGIYICSIKANNYFSTRKMLLVK